MDLIGKRNDEAVQHFVERFSEDHPRIPSWVPASFGALEETGVQVATARGAEGEIRKIQQRHEQGTMGLADLAFSKRLPVTTAGLAGAAGGLLPMFHHDPKASVAENARMALEEAAAYAALMQAGGAAFRMGGAIVGPIAGRWVIGPLLERASKYFPVIEPYLPTFTAWAKRAAPLPRGLGEEAEAAAVAAPPPPAPQAQLALPAPQAVQGEGFTAVTPSEPPPAQLVQAAADYLENLKSVNPLRYQEVTGERLKAMFEAGPRTEPLQQKLGELFEQDAQRMGRATADQVKSANGIKPGPEPVKTNASPPATPAEVPVERPPVKVKPARVNGRGSEKLDDVTMPAMADMRSRNLADHLASVEDRMPAEGPAWSAETPNGTRAVSGNFAIVDAEKLYWSGKPGSHAVYQPRDFGTQGSMARVASFQTGLRPLRMLESPTTESGAPIVTPGGHALTGNHRLAGLEAAYASDHPTAAAYKQTVIDWGKKHGWEAAKLQEMKRPVLVRVARMSDPHFTLGEFLGESNAATTMLPGTVERATADAPLLEKAMASYNPDEALGSTGNRKMIQSFVDQLPVAEKNEALTSGGVPTALTVERVRRGLLARFLGAHRQDEIHFLLEEARDHGSAGISGTILKVAPSLEGLRGTPYDLSAQMGEAIKSILKAKVNGESIEQSVRQLELGGATASAPQELAELLATGGQRYTQRVLKAYSEIASKVTLPQEGELVSRGTPPTSEEVMKMAEQRVQGEMSAEAKMRRVKQGEMELPLKSLGAAAQLDFPSLSGGIEGRKLEALRGYVDDDALASRLERMLEKDAHVPPGKGKRLLQEERDAIQQRLNDLLPLLRWRANSVSNNLSYMQLPDRAMDGAGLGVIHDALSEGQRMARREAMDWAEKFATILRKHGIRKGANPLMLETYFRAQDGSLSAGLAQRAMAVGVDVAGAINAATELKPVIRQLGGALGLSEQQMLKEYIPHYFEAREPSLEEIRHGLFDRPGPGLGEPRSGPLEHHRLGAVGYQVDPLEAWDRYIYSGFRRVYLKDPMDEVSKMVGPGFKINGRLKTTITSYAQRVLGTPHPFEEFAGQMIAFPKAVAAKVLRANAKATGKLGWMADWMERAAQEPLHAQFRRGIGQLKWLGNLNFVALNPAAELHIAEANYGATLVRYGFKDFARGQADAIKATTALMTGGKAGDMALWREFERTGLPALNQTSPIYEAEMHALHPGTSFDRYAYAMLRANEINGKIVSYMTGRADWLAAHPGDLPGAAEAGYRAVIRTQPVFISAETPAFLSHPLGRATMQFTQHKIVLMHMYKDAIAAAWRGDPAQTLRLAAYWGYQIWRRGLSQSLISAVMPGLTPPSRMAIAAEEAGRRRSAQSLTSELKVELVPPAYKQIKAWLGEAAPRPGVY